MRQVPFPKYIDRQKMFGPLEMDEAISVLVGIFGAIAVGFLFALNVAVALVLGVFLGLGVASVIRNVKRNFAEGFLFHLAYRKGLYHPALDDKTMITKHPEVVLRGLKIIPTGFYKYLVN